MKTYRVIFKHTEIVMAGENKQDIANQCREMFPDEEIEEIKDEETEMTL